MTIRLPGLSSQNQQKGRWNESISSKCLSDLFEELFLIIDHNCYQRLRYRLPLTTALAFRFGLLCGQVRNSCMDALARKPRRVVVSNEPYRGMLDSVWAGGPSALFLPTSSSGAGQIFRRQSLSLSTYLIPHLAVPISFSEYCSGLFRVES